SVSSVSCEVLPVETTVHLRLRTNPCLGLDGSVGWGPNQGQQTGTPPRWGSAGEEGPRVDTQKTSSWPEGYQLSSCAPFRAIVAAQASFLIQANGSPFMTQKPSSFSIPYFLLSSTTSFIGSG